jgi:light-regulated signal transduction histidine kinase (bacteriophytochrome)
VARSPYKDKLDSDADEFIGFAVDGARRMQELINDLLTYSRVGSRALELELVDSNEVVDQIANLGAAVQDSAATVTVERIFMLVASRSTQNQAVAPHSKSHFP